MSRMENPMEVNNKMRKALTDLVEYLNGKVERASKCSRCQYNGKSFRGESYCLHEDCGISYCDKKARDKAMYLLKRFKLQEALAEPIRNCHVGTADEQLERYGLFCQNKCPICENRHSCYICGERRRMKCMMEWQQMPYEKGGAK